MKKMLMTSLAVATLLLSGCGNSTSSTGTTGTEGNSTSGGTTGGITGGTTSGAIDGTWVSSSTENGATSTQTLIVGNGIYDYSAQSVSPQAEIKIVSKYSYSEVGSKTVQPNNLTATKVTTRRASCSFKIKVIDASTVSSFNSQNFCGKADWTAGVEVDVTGTSCDQACTGSVDDKGLYYVDGSTLYFGDDTQVGSDGYPDALDSSFSYQKQ